VTFAAAIGARKKQFGQVVRPQGPEIFWGSSFLEVDGGLAWKATSRRVDHWSAAADRFKFPQTSLEEAWHSLGNRRWGNSALGKFGVISGLAASLSPGR
jgi:hypothetical protein